MEGIGFKNMKVLKDEQWFDFKDITLLTGTNNSGKSSVINAMQMLQENISGRSMDELLRTEFKVRANQNKYGSIVNFVNNNTSEEDGYFAFVRKFRNLEYKFKVSINNGLESFGSISEIKVTDNHSKETVFRLIVKNSEPKRVFTFKTNYRYFLERFNEKCRNTEILHVRKKELDDLKDLVNKGVKSFNDLEALAKEIGNQVSVYIDVYESLESSNIDDPTKIDSENSDETNSYASYYIHNDDEHHNLLFDSNKIEEIKVFFKEDDINTTIFSGPIKEEKYKELLGSVVRFGVFDFSRLWQNNAETKTKFEKIVCDYYNKSFEESNKLFCDDLIRLASNTYWNTWSKFEIENENIANRSPFNLLEQSFFGLPDMGVMALSLDIKGENDNQGRNPVASHTLEGKGNIDTSSDAIKELMENGFFNHVYYKLSDLILETYVESKEFELQRSIISEFAYKEIYSDISQKLLDVNFGLNNIYVSSNRFVLKRSHSFNDNTDFTRLLKIVEGLTQTSKDESYEFINKWIKEFDLADELVLKPDSETGDFKAYLKTNDRLTLLTDYGLGTNQILPIIFALGIHEYYATKYDNEILSRTVVIEEPEANLHPALQSKLADMFVEAGKKFHVKIIAETHSEYLIRKLQYLVATSSNKLKPDEVVIYYFYKPNRPEVVNGEVKQVERIEIDRYGRLSKEFGSGFFDEADNISIELFLLSNKQNN